MRSHNSVVTTTLKKMTEFSTNHFLLTSMTLPPIIQLEAFLATPQQDENLEALRQEYETVLTLLETHFLEAIVSKEWGEFEEFVNHFKE